jgi:hypothetical protein
VDRAHGSRIRLLDAVTSFTVSVSAKPKRSAFGRQLLRDVSGSVFLFPCPEEIRQNNEQLLFF